ncbi:MAG TPA: hypothetical protein VK843_13195 [Planctomycetota bacterium]|nr:hypothetical protein [Planctomycetota bacterium]
MRLALLVILCALSACNREATPPPLPPVEIVGLAGLETRIANAHGKPLILNFWAMW